MAQRAGTSDVKLPGHEEPIAPVTILDEQGRVVRVVQSSEFRRAAATRQSRALTKQMGPSHRSGAFLRKADGMTPWLPNEAS